MTTILSVHVPKTAGTSLTTQWNYIFGNDLVYIDSTFNPLKLVDQPQTKLVNPADFKVVHGSLKPHRYSDVEDLIRITFLRHPIDNLLSIYSFLIARHDALFGFNFKGRESFKEFISLFKYRFLYTHTFFGDFDMGSFDFIGDFNNYSAELGRLGEMLNLTFDPSIKKNITAQFPGCPSAYKNNRKELLSQLYNTAWCLDLLSDDIAFYEQWKGK